jgi:hypothetical protein
VALLLINVSFATLWNIKSLITHIVKQLKTCSRTRGALWNQKKKTHNQHGVGYDYSELNTQNEGHQGKRAMKNKNYYRLD